MQGIISAKRKKGSSYQTASRFKEVFDEVLAKLK
jgi:hypothetical protein